MNILAVITARGGSKGIPKKNIVPLCGKPLLVYTIESALAAKLNGRVVVSTDDDEIAAVAKKYRVQVIKRPPEISGDTASSESALLHALDVLEKEKYFPDAILLLQPTSPLRKAETIRKFVAKFEDIKDEYEAMLSLHKDKTDFWVNKGGVFSRLFPNAPRRRQAREPLYAENSALYITNVEALRKTNSVLGSVTAGFVIDADEAVDINEPRDILLAELLLKKRNV